MWILDGLNLKVIENAGAVKNGKIENDFYYFK
jgi:hypothetical protein